MDPVWSISGLPGGGKTTLFNFLTSSNRRVGDGLQSITTKAEAVESITKPTKDYQNKRFFCDTEGVGDATVEDVADLVKNTAPTLIRIIKGSTGVIICLKFDRLLMQEKFLIKQILELCQDIPFIFCFCKYDEKFENSSLARKWIEEQLPFMKSSLSLPKDFVIKFAAISVHKKDIADLELIIRTYDDAKYATSSIIAQVRKNSGSQSTGVEIKPEEFESILTNVVKYVIQVARSPWFIQLMQGIPFVGTLVTIIDALAAHRFSAWGKVYKKVDK